MLYVTSKNWFLRIKHVRYLVQNVPDRNGIYQCRLSVICYVGNKNLWAAIYSIMDYFPMLRRSDVVYNVEDLAIRVSNNNHSRFNSDLLHHSSTILIDIMRMTPLLCGTIDYYLLRRSPFRWLYTNEPHRYACVGLKNE